MRRGIHIMLVICVFLLCGASYAKAAENKPQGYFEYTKTVLLLPALGKGESAYAASRLDKEMENIFRYPYYRLLDGRIYEGKTIFPEMLSDLARESGADIVVMPLVADWTRWRFHRSFFSDADDIIETRVVVHLYSWNEKEQALRDDESRYREREEEGFVRDRYIMDEVMKRLMKNFPYRRVPIDAKDMAAE